MFNPNPEGRNRYSRADGVKSPTWQWTLIQVFIAMSGLRTGTHENMETNYRLGNKNISAGLEPVMEGIYVLLPHLPRAGVQVHTSCNISFLSQKPAHLSIPCSPAFVDGRPMRVLPPPSFGTPPWLYCTTWQRISPGLLVLP